MGQDEFTPVAVSKTIAAPAAAIFAILADPKRHPDLDGSGMLRPGTSSPVVSQVGDVFAMKMHHPQMGDYEMDNYVVAYEPDRTIGWEPRSPGSDPQVDSPTRNGSRWLFELAPDGPSTTVVTEIYDCSGSSDDVRTAVNNGQVWVGAMTKTLDQLAAITTDQARP
jgi:Polyketide cyclase / dehydrase and lipid transport